MISVSKWRSCSAHLTSGISTILASLAILRNGSFLVRQRCPTMGETTPSVIQMPRFRFHSPPSIRERSM